MRYLLCYEIGHPDGRGQTVGSAFWTMPALTQAALEKASEEIVADVKAKNPHMAFTNLVWRSVTPLHA